MNERIELIKMAFSDHRGPARRELFWVAVLCDRYMVHAYCLLMERK